MAEFCPGLREFAMKAEDMKREAPVRFSTGLAELHGPRLAAAMVVI